MAVDTIAEQTEPEPGPYDPILEPQGNATLERWLPQHAALVVLLVALDAIWLDWAAPAAGYPALLGLRPELPAARVGKSLLVVLLQGAILITIPAVLVLCGSARLARPGSPALSYRATLAAAPGRTIRRPITAS